MSRKKSSSGKRLSDEWLEIIVVAVCLVAFLAFAVSVIDSQERMSEERAGLLSLRENWGRIAAYYNLRDSTHSSATDFIVDYRAFRARPVFLRLVTADSQFSSLANQAEWALSQLEFAEECGDRSAARYAGIFDRVLGAMATRVGDYSKERLTASRFILLLMSLALVAGSFVFLHMMRRLRTSSEEQRISQELTRALFKGQEEERLRISRELHDAVAQDLAAAKLYCGLAGSADAAHAAQLLDKSISEVREICQGLRPAELDKLGIAEACSRLCSERGRAWNIDVAYSSSGVAGKSFPVELEINLYRILQEALNNIRRHSGAKRVRVRLAASAEALQLEVADDGVGPGLSSPGLGRRGMAERAEMLGGTFIFGPGPTGGSHVSVRIPLGTELAAPAAANSRAVAPLREKTRKTGKGSV